MKNAYIDDLQIHDFQDSSIGYSIFPKILGLDSADIRNSKFARPNADGAVMANQLYGERVISFQGLVNANDITTYRARRKALQNVTAIKRDTDGEIQPHLFKFLTDDNIPLQIEVFTMLDMPDEHMMHVKYKLDLICPKFQLLGQTPKNTNVFVFQGGGWTIPFGIPFGMAVSGSTFSDIINGGNIDAYPFYTLVGPLTNPTFTNVTSGEQFSLAYTLAANEIIEIDTLYNTVVFRTVAGATPTNIRQYFSGTFLLMKPDTNQVKFSTGNVADTGYISVNIRDTNSGV